MNGSISGLVEDCHAVAIIDVGDAVTLLSRRGTGLAGIGIGCIGEEGVAVQVVVKRRIEGTVPAAVAIGSVAAVEGGDVDQGERRAKGPATSLFTNLNAARPIRPPYTPVGDSINSRL